MLEALGRAYEGIGEVPRAIEHYEEYLEADPTAANRREVESRLAALRVRQPAAPRRPEDQRELDEIESSARTATALYSVGILTSAMGAGLVVGGLASATSNVGDRWFCGGSSCGPPPDRTGFDVLLISGAAALLGGLVMVFLGVGFDQESGRRRVRLRERSPRAALVITPFDDAVAVTLRF